MRVVEKSEEDEEAESNFEFDQELNAEVASQFDEGVDVECWSASGRKGDRFVLAVETTPRREKGKAPVMEKFRGSMSRKKKIFKKIMTLLLDKCRGTGLKSHTGE